MARRRHQEVRRARAVGAPEDDFKLKDVAFCLPEANVAELFVETPSAPAP